MNKPLKFFAFLLALIFVLCGCNEEPTPQKDWQEQGETEKFEEIEVPERNEEFYPYTGTFANIQSSGLIYASNFIWNEYGGITFFNESELTVLSSENEIVKTVVLEIPFDSFFDEYYIRFGESLIFVYLRNGGFYSEDGLLKISGALVYDFDGNLIREYPLNGEAELLSEIGFNDLCFGKGNTAFFGAAEFGRKLKIGYYDFDADRGEILLTGNQPQKRNEEGRNFALAGFFGEGAIFSVVNYSKAYWVENPVIEPPADYVEEWNVQTGTDNWMRDEIHEIWYADKDGAKKLCDGKILAVGEDFYVYANAAGELAFSDFYGSGKTLAWEDGTPIDNWAAKTVSVNESRINFRTNRKTAEDHYIFHFYDVKTGEIYSCDTGHTVFTNLLGTEINGTPLFCFSSIWAYDDQENYKLFLYDTSKGHSLCVAENFNGNRFLSPKLNFYVESVHIDGVNYIRIADIEN